MLFQSVRTIRLLERHHTLCFETLHVDASAFYTDLTCLRGLPLQQLDWHMSQHDADFLVGSPCVPHLSRFAEHNVLC